jgi:hypothetical protein
VGQVFGFGYSGGDKSKSSTTVNLPPELQKFYKQQTQSAGRQAPQYQDLMRRVMQGDTSAVSQYAQPVAGSYKDVLGQAYTPQAGSYQNTESTYTPMAGSYKNVESGYVPISDTYTPMSGTYNPVSGTYREVASAYTPVAGNFASVANTFQPGKEAYTAPYAGAMQQAQQQIRRQTPSGGGQLAALGQATMGGAMQMGAARAAQGQRDIDATNALRQEDVRTKMGLDVKDTEQLGGLRQEDVRGRNTLAQEDVRKWASLLESDTTNRNAYARADAEQRGGLRQEDIRAGNTLEQKDLEQLAARRLEDKRASNTLTQKDLDQYARLREGDASARNQLAAGDVTNTNQMMQKILQYYAQLYGGYNPQVQAGTSSTSSTGARLGIPFADIGV